MKENCSGFLFKKMLRDVENFLDEKSQKRSLDQALFVQRNSLNQISRTIEDFKNRRFHNL